jgi:hypothetical protein
MDPVPMRIILAVVGALIGAVSGHRRRYRSAEPDTDRACAYHCTLRSRCSFIGMEGTA